MITYLKRKVTNWTRPDLLFEVNEIQKLILAQTTEQIRVVDSTTGLPPFLATTAGTYQYDAPAGARRILGLFVRDFLGAQNNSYTKNSDGYVYAGRMFLEQRAKFTDALEGGTLATITFPDDPGTTTETYYLDYEGVPPEVVSESISLGIPAKHHLKMVDGVLARIRSEKFGSKSEWEYWENVTMPKIISDLSQGSLGNVGKTQTQPEYQYYGRDYYGRTHLR